MCTRSFLWNLLQRVRSFLPVVLFVKSKVHFCSSTWVKALHGKIMGSKRKHNQSSTAGTGQTDVLPSPKKAKVDRAQANSSLHQSPASSKLPATSPDLKRQAIGTTQTSAKPEQDTTSGLSKSARKRLRKRQALRGAKKPLSADKTEQAAKEVDIQRPSKKPSTESTSAKPRPHTPKPAASLQAMTLPKALKLTSPNLVPIDHRPKRVLLLARKARQKPNATTQ